MAKPITLSHQVRSGGWESMISANGGLPAHRYTPQVTPRWPRGSEPASEDTTVGTRARTQKGRTTTEEPALPHPRRTPHNPWRCTPPTHAAGPQMGRRTDHTSSRPPATRHHTGEGGRTYTGRKSCTHRGSRREHHRAAHHHALTARRQPRPPQGPTRRHRKRTKARPQHPGLEAGTPRGHGTKAEAPREGNPADT